MKRGRELAANKQTELVIKNEAGRIMLLVRLVLGAGASIAAGVACAAVRSSTRLPRYVFALLLFALFVPVHVSLWDKFPIWYHIIFLGSLAPLVVLGTKLLGSRGGV